jgi:hypothetical protein
MLFDTSNILQVMKTLPEAKDEDYRISMVSVGN